jgi:hypothetical protein
MRDPSWDKTTEKYKEGIKQYLIKQRQIARQDGKNN